jgi:hypothetical protein
MILYNTFGCSITAGNSSAIIDPARKYYKSRHSGPDPESSKPESGPKQ